jgi:hypothetical protein
MDPRIAEYIRANERTYTREAIRLKLIDAGHDPAEIDRTWEMLHARDPDEVAGPGFWARFFLFLIGLNVAVLLLVGLSTGMFAGLGSGYGVMLVILAIALGIGALIAWGIVAIIGPEKLGRTTATVVGVAIPLLFAFLIGGSCYALASAIGPPPPPPVEGVMEVGIEPPLEFSGSGPVYCQSFTDGLSFSVYAQETGIGTIEGRRLHVYVDVFTPGLEGGPVPTGEAARNLNINVSLHPGSGTEAPRQWFVTPETQLEVDVAPDGLTGDIAFQDLQGGEFQEPNVSEGESISGTISWTCEERGNQ